MPARENRWLIALAVFALAGTVACERQPDATRTHDPIAQTAPDRDRADTRITTSVQARFYTDDQVRGEHIDVITQDAVVTLRGTVPHEQARQRALELARGVEGVHRVEDEMQVRTDVAEGARPETGAVPTTGVDPVPPMPPATESAPETAPGRPVDRDRDPAAERDTDRTDRVNAGWITTRIQAQYFVTPGVAPWRVDVTTSPDGVVTLEGHVDSEENRRRAVEIARNTSGVVRVDDRLRVRPEDTGTATDRERDDDGNGEAIQPDIWITTKIQSKYFLDGDVRGRNINVTTNDGVVTLQGEVRSERERRQAVALARNTDGVREVRDELRIDAEAREHAPGVERRADDPARVGEHAADRDGRVPTGEPGQPLDDERITTRVQSQLYMQQELRGRQIEVETRNGVVTLRGEVENDATRRLAEQIARDTEGVRRVDNQLKVGAAARQ